MQMLDEKQAAEIRGLSSHADISHKFLNNKDAYHDQTGVSIIILV